MMVTQGPSLEGHLEVVVPKPTYKRLKEVYLTQSICSEFSVI